MGNKYDKFTINYKPKVKILFISVTVFMLLPLEFLIETNITFFTIKITVLVVIKGVKGCLHFKCLSTLNTFEFMNLFFYFLPPSPLPPENQPLKIKFKNIVI